MAELPPPTELEGGFIHIRAKVYRGTIRRRDDHRIVWTCKHNHYRPEYNARHSQDTRQVWETSGLNCGRAAYAQHLKGEKIHGDIGMVGDPDVPIAMRDDARLARVGKENYLGRVRLTGHGHRILSVSHDATTLSGTVNLDVAKSKAVRVNTTNTDSLRSWATAAWLLKGGIWGVTFQDPRVRMESEGVIERAVEELLEADSKPGPKKLAKKDKQRIVLPDAVPVRKRPVSTAKQPEGDHPKKLVEVFAEKKHEPHIRVGHNERGRRVFEVVGPEGTVLDQFVHRGQAVERLAKVKEAK